MMTNWVKRPEATVRICTELGIPLPPKGQYSTDVDRVYDALFKVYGNDDLTVKGNGKTGRVKKAKAEALYEFVKDKYGIEIPEWAPDPNHQDESVNLVEQPVHQVTREQDALTLIKGFLDEFNNNKITSDVFAGAVRGIFVTRDKLMKLG